MRRLPWSSKGLWLQLGTALASQTSELRVVIEPRPVGSRASYIVRAETPEKLDAVRGFFVGLSEVMDVRPLADGFVSAYAVQHFDPNRRAHADIESFLRRHFEVVICGPSVNAETMDLIHTLCVDTGSRELEVDRCGICNTPQPFPTTIVTVSDPIGHWRRRRVYCTQCIANVSNVGQRDLVRALLTSDTERFAWARGAAIMADERSTLRGGRVAFRLSRRA